jgi:hypothetical protein
MSDLIERLKSVKWEESVDGDRMPDDPAYKCVFVDMRPDDFRNLLSEAAELIAERDALYRFVAISRNKLLYAKGLVDAIAIRNSKQPNSSPDSDENDVLAMIFNAITGVKP